jgi:putative sugar O-methyltransferase
MKTSISDNNTYPNFCEKASQDEELFKNFRTNKFYNEILEHVTKEEGEKYLNIVKNKNINLFKKIEKYKNNDKIGSPLVFKYDVGELSPTTIRYIKVLSDLIENFGDLDGMDIVEIGCGYGGQSKIIMDTFNIKSYTLIDLEPVLKLTKKYLESFDLDLSKIKFKTLSNLDNDVSYDLFISNYAYTECDKKIQLDYFDKVLSKSSKGYLTANFINSYFNLDYLSKNEILEKIPNSFTIEEEPKTHPNNIIIIWK